MLILNLLLMKKVNYYQKTQKKCNIHFYFFRKFKSVMGTHYQFSSCKIIFIYTHSYTESTVLLVQVTTTFLTSKKGC